jgi:hypothetical protein
MEDHQSDFLNNYFNKDAKLTTANTQDQLAVDSQRVDIGYVRPPPIVTSI